MPNKNKCSRLAKIGHMYVQTGYSVYLSYLCLSKLQYIIIKSELYSYRKCD